VAKDITIEEALLEIWPHIFGDLVLLKSQSEDWLSVLEMPLRKSIDSQELEELLSKFFSDVNEGHAELVQFLKPNKTKRITQLASEVEPEPIRWIVKDVLKDNAIHLLAGDPDAGKSFVSLEIASQISKGGELFGYPVEQGKVLIFGAEDSVNDTVVPRLLSQGANLKNIRIFSEDESLTFPDNINKVAVECAFERPSVIIFDTINSFLGEKTDTKSDKDLRRALLPLKKLADYYNCAFIFITHLNKSDNKKATYRINGSIAYVGLSRLVWFFAEDPDTEEKIFSVVKNNVGKKPSYKFELDLTQTALGGQPKLNFLGETDELAHEIGVEIKTEPISVVDECAETMKDFVIKEGGRVESLELENFILESFSLSCFKRARTKLKGEIRSKKEGRVWFTELVEPLETDEDNRRNLA
jgi:archaellum biogenesis ATPase FlaH